MDMVYGFTALQALGLGLGGLALFAFVFLTVRTSSYAFRVIAGLMTLALVASVWVNVNFVNMAKDGGALAWPAVARCAVCGNRIYAWEESETLRVWKAVYVPPDEWYRASRHMRKERAVAGDCDERDDDCSGDFTMDDVIDLHVALDTSGSMTAKEQPATKYRHTHCR